MRDPPCHWSADYSTTHANFARAVFQPSRSGQTNFGRCLCTSRPHSIRTAIAPQSLRRMDAARESYESADVGDEHGRFQETFGTGAGGDRKAHRKFPCHAGKIRTRARRVFCNNLAAHSRKLVRCPFDRDDPPFAKDTIDRQQRPLLRKQSGQLIERVGYFCTQDQKRCDHQIEAKMHDGF